MDTQKQIPGEFDELDRECTAVLRQNGWDGQALMRWPSGFDYMRLRTRIANLPSARVTALCLAHEDDPMGRGCCSWHGGECGCQDGRDMCCDGTFSPSCTCHK
jgi:hypothetical protein